MLQSVPYRRTFTQALGAAAPLAIPADIQPIEIWAQGSAVWNVIGDGVGDPAFPVAASTIYRLPTNTIPIVSGTGTLTVLVFGIPNTDLSRLSAR